MISNLDPASELFLADVGRIQQKIADANRQVSSGKRITVAADAPDEISSLLQLRADRQHNTQIQSNLTLAKTDATSADNALGAAIQLMDRALVIAGQGASSTQGAGTRQTLADEVQAIQQQMVSFSQTAVQGRYIFSGDASDTPAYTYDPASLAAINGVVQLSSAPATAQLENPAGGSFPASKTAQQIFDTRDAVDPTIMAPDNVFAALNNLRNALLTNDPTVVTNSLDFIKQASAHLNSMQAFYGNVQTRIQGAVDFAGNYDTQLQTQISGKEDADIVSAAISITLANTQLQAAFQMRAKMPHSSLFDFLG